MKIIKKIIAFSIMCSVAFTSLYSIGDNTVKADDNVLVSEDITVDGCQIKTNVAANEGVAFRTVCKAPDIGSVIEIDGAKYTVKKMGTIYVKDINTTGFKSNNLLDTTYTLLDVNQLSDAVKKAYGFEYIGSSYYKGAMLTFGYVATDSGVLKQKDGVTTYVRTMTDMDAYKTNSLWIRAFIVAADTNGNDVIIYGKYTFLTSFAQIAYSIYTKGLAPTLEGHKYLYNTILHKLPTYNPFYIENEEQYGWGGVVTP